MKHPYCCALSLVLLFIVTSLFFTPLCSVVLAQEKPSVHTSTENKNLSLAQNFIDNKGIANVGSFIEKGTYNPTKENDENVRTVEGKVVSEEDGMPIFRVNVQDNENKGVHTFTNENGVFQITIPESVKSLRFTHIGYRTLVYTLNKKENKYIVRMTPKNDSLAEVVVKTGIYNRSASQFTGSVRTITSEELRKISPTNILSAISVLDPSFSMPENINIGSDPNKLPDLELRGQNTFPDQTSLSKNSSASLKNVFGDKPNSPLFILDGFQVPLQRIFDLDMNRVSRITVLKDASATSIYGSRGNNGVIVIETKLPTEGIIRLTYRGGTTFELPDLSGYNLLNAREKLQFEKEVGYYTANTPALQRIRDVEYNENLKNVTKGVDTYWLSQPLNTVSVGQNHSLYMEGGNQFIRYGVNLFSKESNGVMKGSNRSQLNGGFTLSYRTSRLVFANDLSINSNKSNESPYGSFSDYTKQNPYWDIYDSTGRYAKFLGGVRAGSTASGTQSIMYENPLYNASLPYKNNSSQFGITNNFKFEWNMLEWFRWTGALSYTHNRLRSDMFISPDNTKFATDSLTRRGQYDQTFGQTDIIEGNMGFDLRKTWNNHLLNFVANVSMQQAKDYNVANSVIGFPDKDVTDIFYGRLYNDNSNRPTGSQGIARLISGRLNANYSYKNKYIADFSTSLDASSQFGTNKQLAPFWSLGAAWNIHNETFMKNQKIFSLLKLRGSVGTTGDQNFPPYMALSIYDYYLNNFYLDHLSSYLLGYGNSSLGWQKGFKRNIGVDVLIWKGRINFVADVYSNITDNLILDISTPPSLGFTSYKENAGSLLNNGWQASLNVTVLQKPDKDFFWRVGISAFSNKNTINKISNSLKRLNELSDQQDLNEETSFQARSTPRLYYQEGQSITALYAVRSLGIDPSTGQELYLGKDGKATYIWKPSDKVVVGDTRPRLSGTLLTNIDYRGFSLGLYFTYRLGAEIYNQTLVDRVENPNIVYNVDRRVAEERWRKPGDQSFYKGIVSQAGTDGGPISSITLATSRFVQKEYMIAASNFSLSYQFPSETQWLKKLKMSNTRIELFAANPFQVSTIKRERGLDYPFSHTYTVNISTSIF